MNWGFQKIRSSFVCLLACLFLVTLTTSSTSNPQLQNGLTNFLFGNGREENTENNNNNNISNKNNNNKHNLFFVFLLEIRINKLFKLLSILTNDLSHYYYIISKQKNKVKWVLHYSFFSALPFKSLTATWAPKCLIDLDALPMTIISSPYWFAPDNSGFKTESPAYREIPQHWTNSTPWFRTSVPLLKYMILLLVNLRNELKIIYTCVHSPR